MWYLAPFELWRIQAITDVIIVAATGIVHYNLYVQVRPIMFIVFLAGD